MSGVPRAAGDALVAAAALFLLSCEPGTNLGTYMVKGQLVSNSCGGGIGAPSPWEFRALLWQAGQTVYWSFGDASPLLSGPLSGGTHVTLTGHEVANVDGTNTTMGPCDLTRSDDLELTLSSAASPSGFSVTVSYAFAEQQGAVCADQLAANGGMYAVLPCSVSYTVTASRTGN